MACGGIGFPTGSLPQAVSLLESDRDSGFDSVVVGADTLGSGAEKARAGKSLHVGMDVAVVAAEPFGQGADAGDVVAADVVQKLHALAGKDAGKGIPAFEGEMTLVEGLTMLGAMPGVNEF